MIVFANGCFDILHPGHIHTLKFAKQLAGQDGKVIVGLNSDSSIALIKRKPIFNEQFRKTMLESLRYVDEVRIFETETPYLLIKEIKPDYIVKGPDYINKQVIGNDIALVLFASQGLEISTTKIIEEIKKR